MDLTLAFPPLTSTMIACTIFVLIGSAVQVAAGTGLSVICGPFLMLWIGPAAGVPILLSLNLLVSAVATACDSRTIQWPDAFLAAGATFAGCVFASLIPGLSDSALKLITACVLLIVALPRPPSPDKPLSTASATAGITLAGLITGALTVWTATPGPITPAALTRAGRSGSDIRRTMQPISVVGYGGALAWVGLPVARSVSEGPFLLLIATTLVGIGAGYAIRPRTNPEQATLLIRIVAAAAAVLLIASVLR